MYYFLIMSSISFVQIFNNFLMHQQKIKANQASDINIKREINISKT